MILPERLFLALHDSMLQYADPDQFALLLLDFDRHALRSAMDTWIAPRASCNEKLRAR
jgi:hypothetical protein